jgi:hypothetical protein
MLLSAEMRGTGSNALGSSGRSCQVLPGRSGGDKLLPWRREAAPPGVPSGNQQNPAQVAPPLHPFAPLALVSYLLSINPVAHLMSVTSLALLTTLTQPSSTEATRLLRTSLMPGEAGEAGGGGGGDVGERGGKGWLAYQAGQPRCRQEGLTDTTACTPYHSHPHRSGSRRCSGGAPRLTHPRA